MASERLERIIKALRERGSAGRGGKFNVQRNREQMDAAAFRVAPDIRNTAVEAGGVKAEWVEAPDAAADRVIMYLHGGGYVAGSLLTHRELVGRLSRASGARALSVDYRLAPEHPFPAAIEDATAAYRWLLAQGIAPGKIVIAGDSAGGGLTIAALLAIRDAKLARPAAGVAISPWVDLEGSGESVQTRAAADPMVQGDGLKGMAKLYLGDVGPRAPLASPIYADLKGLPPLLIHVGDAEVLLDDSTRLAGRAKAAGVDVRLEVWPEMIHVWHVFAPLLPEGQRGIEAVAEYIREKTAA